MPRKHTPDDWIAQLKDLGRRVDKVQNKQRFDTKNDPPPLPPNVHMTIEIKENKTHVEYRGIVEWDVISPNTCQADVDYWEVKIRPVNAAGNNVHSQYIRERTVTMHTDVTAPSTVYETLEHPSKWYWQAAVRIIDKAHRKGPWSSWTSPQLPTAASLPKPPVPTGISINFDTDEKTRHKRIRANVSFNEVGPWDIPPNDSNGAASDKEDDVSGYEVEFRRCDASGNPVNVGQPRGHHVTADKEDNNIRTVTFDNIHKHYFYQTRVRSIDRYHRRGDFSSWTAAATPSDTTNPPVPISVKVYGAINKVGIEWDAPAHSSDPELISEDIEYFQVQISLTGGFNKVIHFDKYINHTGRREFKTKHYSTRYWIRVRSVDASGNKSAWVAGGGSVHPTKVKGTKKSPVDLDWTNNAGVELSGGQTNRAAFTGVGRKVAVLDPGVADGVFGTSFTTSPTTDRTRAGMAFRCIDSNNFLFMEVRKIATGVNDVRLMKYDGGVESLLVAGTGAPPFKENQEYELQVILEGAFISLWVGPTLVVDQYQLTGANATKFTTPTRVGLTILQGATDDDKGSRWEDLFFTADVDDDLLSDDFDRAPSATLGTAVVGGTWNALSGTWAIVNEQAPSGVYGMGVIQPIFYYSDTTQRTAITAPNNSVKVFAGPTLTFDRPVKIIIWGFVEINNADTVPMPLQVYLPVLYNGTHYNGGPAREQLPNDGARHQIHNFRQYYISLNSPTPLTLKWGIKQMTTAATKKVTIFRMKMIAFVSYAPDIATNPVWTKDPPTQAVYKGMEVDEA